MKTEPVTAGADATIYVGDVGTYVQCISGPETRHTVFRCIGSNRDRLGFYVEIRMIVGIENLFCLTALMVKRINAKSEKVILVHC